MNTENNNEYLFNLINILSFIIGVENLNLNGKQIEKLEKHEIDYNYPIYLMYGIDTELLDSLLKECENNEHIKLENLKKR